MIKTKNLIKEISKLISKNFGKSMSKYYEEFYADKDSETILLSCRELLTELVGQKNADKQLLEIYNKFKIKEAKNE